MSGPRFPIEHPSTDQGSTGQTVALGFLATMRLAKRTEIEDAGRPVIWLLNDEPT